MPQKLILKNHQSPGDIVMLTAAVRELHRAWPGRFVTDVRTPCPALWEHNPYITTIPDAAVDAGEAIAIDCEYPAIHQSNEGARHFLWGFVEDLERKLRLRGEEARGEEEGGRTADDLNGEPISRSVGEADPPVGPIAGEADRASEKPTGRSVLRSDGLRDGLRITDFKGDIYLSDEEKGWMSQIEEITGVSPEVEPYWIIVAGGKWDFTIKWWGATRWQAVAEGIRERFGRRVVQIGETGAGHYHPELRGLPSWLIDLRGKTDLRQLVRLVYHAEGVVCPVTLAMHLAAAVPVPAKAEYSVFSDQCSDSGDEGSVFSNQCSVNSEVTDSLNTEHRILKTPPARACVVVAGGREPPHWEAYPTHQFLHTVGTLPCCATGGCWKSRTVAIGGGDEKDERLCVDVAGESGLPRCMDKISAEDVLTAVGRYF